MSVFTYDPPCNYAEAKEIQEKLRHRVSLDDLAPKSPRLIAGIDVGYDKKRKLSKAAVVLMAGEPLALVKSAIAIQQTPFPYIPGMLSFREAPAILEALESLGERPDLLMVDGHGIAHPRRIGIASHIGILTGIPAIGIAKKRLIGSHGEPGCRKGDRALLMDGEEQIGTVICSRDHVKPLFISPGHMVSHKSACRLVLTALGGYRLPEPTRLADKLSKIRRASG